jgi:trk system potassium uptake protein
MQDNSTETESPESKPGDRFYRVPRIRPLKIILPRFRPRRPVGVSIFTLVYGFAALIAVGTVLLMMPFSSRSGEWTSFINSLFTATSAVCVNGLVVEDTFTYWTFAGQAIILVLIQLGGFGFMTSATVLMIAASRRIGFRGRILISEPLGAPYIGGVNRLIRNILYFALAAELVGALIFVSPFSSQYGWIAGIWRSLFQSVSAFNNAGFDLVGGFTSLISYQTNYLVILTTAILALLGGISFLVLRNLFSARGLHSSTIDTKLVLLVTGLIMGMGTILVLVTEYNNPQTLGNLTLPHKILVSFFHSAAARTSGFATMNAGAMLLFTLLVTMIMMFIGGSTGSTAGGIKVNTVGLLLATIWNTVRGREYPGAFKREFRLQQVFQALTLLIMAIVVVLIVFLILSITENFPSMDVLFETISALSTAGLSTGITPQLSLIGKVMIILAMFVGRLGPLTLIFTLSQTQKITVYRYPKETIRMG